MFLNTIKIIDKSITPNQLASSLLINVVSGLLEKINSILCNRSGMLPRNAITSTTIQNPLIIFSFFILYLFIMCINYVNSFHLFSIQLTCPHICLAPVNKTKIINIVRKICESKIKKTNHIKEIVISIIIKKCNPPINIIANFGFIFIGRIRELLMYVLFTIHVYANKTQIKFLHHLHHLNLFVMFCFYNLLTFHLHNQWLLHSFLTLFLLKLQFVLLPRRSLLFVKKEIKKKKSFLLQLQIILQNISLFKQNHIKQSMSTTLCDTKVENYSILPNISKELFHQIFKKTYQEESQNNFESSHHNSHNNTQRSVIEIVRKKLLNMKPLNEKERRYQKQQINAVEKQKLFHNSSFKLLLSIP